MAFLHINNKLSKKESRKIVPRIITSKRIKHSEVNLTKEVKDIYTETYKTLMRATDEDTNIWKDILCPWIGRTDIVKISIIPKVIYGFIVIPIKILNFTEVEKQS